MTTRKHGLGVRTLLVILLAASTGSCDSLLGPGSPDVEIDLNLQLNSLTHVELIVEVAGERERLTATAEERSSRGGIGGLPYGVTPVVAVIRNAARDTIATAQFTQNYRRDYLHGISVSVGPQRPWGFCSSVVAATALVGSGTDSLFVSAGALPKDAVC